MLEDLYIKYDLSMEQDMFGFWFSHDPSLIFISPSFKTKDEVNDFLKRNAKNIAKILD